MSTGWYGVMLLAYLMLAIWTLSVFTLYQGAVEFGEIADDHDTARLQMARERARGLAQLRQCGDIANRAEQADDRIEPSPQAAAIGRPGLTGTGTPRQVAL